MKLEGATAGGARPVSNTRAMPTETSESGLRLHGRSPRKVKPQNENVFEIDHPIPA